MANELPTVEQTLVQIAEALQGIRLELADVRLHREATDKARAKWSKETRAMLAKARGE